MNKHKLTIKHFHSEPIEVGFTTAPVHQKSPHCPTSFTWQNITYQIKRCLREWKDFGRQGRMAHNMQPQHAAKASQHGSWGVGRFYFEVETESQEMFRIYYDRAPNNAFDRAGHWVLLAELTTEMD